MTSVHRSYLDRYRAGEHVAVWEELVALGGDVRREPVYSDARAVARETMTRVRHNVALLAARLREMDFRFVYPDEVIVPPDARLVARLDRMEAELGPMPIAVRAFFEHVGSVNLMGSHPRLGHYAAAPDVQRAFRDAAASAAGQAAGATTTTTPGALGGIMGMMQEMMRRMREVQEDVTRAGAEGRVPDRLRANSAFADALAGSLGLRVGPPGGSAAPTARHDVVSDPLVVEAPPYDELEEYRELGDPDDPNARDDEGWTGRYRLEIAPDALHKANISGGSPYAIAIPDPGADAPVLELDAPYARTFVGYLRECFRWGGFPGLADEPDPPTAELARLTEGLLPF